MITLFGWPPAFDCQSSSPFVIKTMIQLDMLGVEYEMDIVDFEEAPFGKGPYVIDKDHCVGDSTLIRHYFENQLSKDLDEGLSKEEKAVSWAFDRMIETHLDPVMVYYRWLVPENFESGPKHFFSDIPEDLRQRVIDNQLDKIGCRLNKLDVFRVGEENMIWFAHKTITEISTYLSNKPYFMGDKVTAIDAMIYAFMSSCATRVFETPLVEIIHSKENIISHMHRMEAEFFATSKW